MKILVVSKDVWDVNNSFGNTFSNLFGGMENVELYNICCKNGESNSDILKESAQLSDKSVLKSIFKKKNDPCSIRKGIEETCDGECGKESSRKFARTTFNYIARDFIWKLGRWKKSETLNDFLDKIKPDVIYLPIYASWYMCDFQLYVIKKLGVPVVGHISDDVYGDLRAIRSPLKRFYVRVLRKKLKKIISECEYLEVFAENMQAEYEKKFGKKCYLIGKGIDFSRQKPNILSEEGRTDGEEVTLLYTGNIGTGRYKVLCDIAKELDNCVGNKKAVLKIYSATQLDNKMSKAFAKYSSLEFLGQISYQEVIEQQKKADYLVFVEDFSRTNVSAVRMSFSTKIIDYMMAEKPIFAVGPNEIYPIQLLKKNDLAIVSVNESELEENLERITSGKADGSVYVDNANRYLRENRDIKVIQKGIFDRLSDIVGCTEGKKSYEGNTN